MDTISYYLPLNHRYVSKIMIHSEIQLNGWT